VQKTRQKSVHIEKFKATQIMCKIYEELLKQKGRRKNFLTKRRLV